MGTSAVEDPLNPDTRIEGPHRTEGAEGRSVGILGGTFNPPHLGHLAVACNARDTLRLQRVVLMPARIPPHKPTGEDPGPEHRLRMCLLAIDGVDGLSACPLEIDRAGPSYTVDTLDAIHARHPTDQLTFIAGADTACTLPAWREPAKLLELADLAVAARDGSGRQGVLDSVAPLIAARGAAGAHGPGLTFLDMPMIEVSSSMVRQRVTRDEPIEDLVGQAVAGYIVEHGLYRDGRRAQS